jgi:hypothetical protein
LKPQIGGRKLTVGAREHSAHLEPQANLKSALSALEISAAVEVFIWHTSTCPPTRNLRRARLLDILVYYGSTKNNKLISKEEKKVEKKERSSPEIFHTTDESDNECKICMDGKIYGAFMPCGHLVACEDCAPRMADCPICRETIQSVL